MSEAETATTRPVLKVIDRRGEEKPKTMRDYKVRERVRAGKWKPQGIRLLVRAILVSDGSVLGGDDHADYNVPYDPRKAMAWEVVAVGAGCAKFWADRGDEPIKKGDFVQHRSVVADTADVDDPNCRFWWVHAEDILGVDNEPFVD